VTKRRGVSEQTIYTWRKRFGGLQATDVRRLRQLEAEIARLKERGLSARRACTLFSVARSALSYRGRKSAKEARENRTTRGAGRKAAAFKGSAGILPNPTYWLRMERY